jgi:hypothetical protein
MPALTLDRAAASTPSRRGRGVTAVASCALAALAAWAAVAWNHAALPPPVALAPLLCLGLLAALWRGGPPQRWRDLPTAAALGVAASVAYLQLGLVRGHDWQHHIWGAAAFQNAWHEGDLLPIWLHHLGLGMPMPMFYGPLPYWAMAPISLAGGGPAQMLAGSFALAGALAGVSAWLAAAAWTGDRRAALVAATAWAFAPYRLLDANYRGALGETWSLALLPLVLVAFDRLLVMASRRRFALAAASVALLFLAHPLSLAALAVVLPALGVARLPSLWRADGVRAIGRGALLGAGASLAGITLAGFLSLPLVVESRHLRLNRVEAYAAFRIHGLEARQLVTRARWDTLRWSRPKAPDVSPADEMPFYIGWPWLAGLAGAAVGAARRREASSNPFAVLAVVGGIALVCSLHSSAPVLSRIPAVSILQFPWRFLGPASAAGALALGALAAAATPRLSDSRARLLALGLALMVVADGFTYSGAVERMERWRGLAAPAPAAGRPGVLTAVEIPEPWPARVFGVFLPPWRGRVDVTEVYNSHPNYYTPTARHTAATREHASVGLIAYVDGTLRRPEIWPYARLWRDGATEPAPLDFERVGGRISVHLPANVAGRVEIAEQYFPGWQVRDGDGWREASASDDGLLIARIEPGDTTLRFRFHRWRWDRSLGWLFTAATALALFATSRPISARATWPRRRGGLLRRSRP